MPTASKGILIRADESVITILLDIDREDPGTYIIAELDANHIMVLEKRVDQLKAKINDESSICAAICWNSGC
ncbi:hypothetical protein BJ878DRAFT_570859 [Calycina marina]|uniref:General transcription and DNA repair factor IIH subunit TFB5 n=1 Tax=Calycina marina TaxID=1763456 RepID=A0A9P8CBI6_9HELO|nr:hypothetical protein BJ878DRAFT_570859 [Calycina marina]